MTHRISLALVVVSLSACWRDVERYEQPVWSDDAVMVAYLHTKFEQRDNLSGWGTEQRNYRHTILVENMTTHARRTYSPEIDGAPTGTIFYMRRGADAQSYIIKSRVDDVDELYELFRNNGTVQVLGRGPLTANGFDNCAFLDVIPSPDGELLAFIERAASCGSQPTVRFKDADTLATVAGPVSVPVTTPMLGITWHPQNHVVISALGNTPVAYAVSTSAQVTSTSVPSCMYPQTTSSAVSKFAQHLSPTDTGVIAGDVDPGAMFGCQSIPAPE